MARSIQDILRQDFSKGGLLFRRETTNGSEPQRAQRRNEQVIYHGEQRGHGDRVVHSPQSSTAALSSR